MDLIKANELLDALAWVEAPFSKMNELVTSLEGEEKKKYIALISDFFYCHFAMTMAIVNKYPDLDPDGKGSESYQKMREKYKQDHQVSISQGSPS